jgi:hypothetical protein
VIEPMIEVTSNNLLSVATVNERRLCWPEAEGPFGM